MTDDELKRCIEAVIRLGNIVRAANDLDQRAEARPAPKPTEASAFAAQVGDAVSPSLIQLLRMCDGIHCFDFVDIDIFSIDYLLQNRVALEEEWVDAGKFEPGEIYVFARSNEDSVAVAFRLRERRAEGEMPVICFDARGVRAEYGSLPEYLRSRQEWFQELVDQQHVGTRGASAAP